MNSARRSTTISRPGKITSLREEVGILTFEKHYPERIRCHRDISLNARSPAVGCANPEDLWPGPTIRVIQFAPLPLAL